MKSRLVQAILLIVLFILGIAFFNTINALQPQEIPAEGAPNP